MLEVTHVSVLDTAMDFDLTHQLLLRSTLCQRRLLDDLGGVKKFRLCINKLEALGEASLAEELAF